MQTIRELRNYLQFILALLSVLACAGLGVYLHLDTSGAVVAALGVYVAGRSASFGAAAVAASRDQACDTRAVISDVKEK